MLKNIYRLTEGNNIMSTIYKATAPSGDTVTIEVDDDNHVPYNALLNLDRAGTIIETEWIWDDSQIEEVMGRYDNDPTAIPVRVPVEQVNPDEGDYVSDLNSVYH